MEMYRRVTWWLVVLVYSWAAIAVSLEDKNDGLPVPEEPGVMEIRLAEHEVTSGSIKEFIVKYNRKVTDSAAEDIGRHILSASQQYEEDPVLVLAVMKTESYFDHKAFSHADARGLMQVRVPVWFNTLNRIGVMRDWRDFYDPERNITAGIFILKHYRKVCSNSGFGLKCVLRKYSGSRSGNKYYDKVMRAVSQYETMYKESPVETRFARI